MTGWQWVGASILALVGVVVLWVYIQFLRDRSRSREDWRLRPLHWWDTDPFAGVGFLLLSITIYAAVALVAGQWEPW